MIYLINSWFFFGNMEISLLPTTDMYLFYTQMN